MRRVGIVWAVAAVMLLGSAAQAAEIPNGSFEDTTNGSGWLRELQDWNVEPDIGSNIVLRAGVFKTWDNFGPTKGDYFAIVTNRLQVDQSIISTEFTLDSAIQTDIRFDYVYMTRWDSEDGGVDPFSVIVTDTGTGDSWTYLVSDPTDTDLGLSLLSTSPFDGEPLRDTGWRTFSVDVEHLFGSTIQIEFLVEDLQPGMSGMFLDNVKLVPEPGTIALFGVGLVGLTLYGRRRRKSKTA